MGSNKGQLVCQHLEGISGIALEDYQAIIRQFAKDRHGVYALYTKSGRLYYVGLASDLRGRLKSHLKDRHAGLWRTFSIYLTLSDSHLKDLESLVLRIASPEGNNQRGKFRKSEDLKRRFIGAISDVQKNVREALAGIKRKKAQPEKIKKVQGRTPVLARYVIFHEHSPTPFS